MASKSPLKYLLLLLVIAFPVLLIIFVTAPIVEDKGILVTLPPSADEVEARAKHLIKVLVNEKNKILLDGEKIKLNQLAPKLKEIFQKNDTTTNYLRNVIISLRKEKGTDYKPYLKVYNKIFGVYNELWEEKSQALFGKPYETLNLEQRKRVKGDIPFLLSEAEDMD